MTYKTILAVILTLTSLLCHTALSVAENIEDNNSYVGFWAANKLQYGPLAFLLLNSKGEFYYKKVPVKKFKESRNYVTIVNGTYTVKENLNNKYQIIKFIVSSIEGKINGLKEGVSFSCNSVVNKKIRIILSQCRLGLSSNSIAVPDISHIYFHDQNTIVK